MVLGGKLTIKVLIGGYFRVSGTSAKAVPGLGYAAGFLWLKSAW